jgi:preprotein translocase subunit SecG
MYMVLLGDDAGAGAKTIPSALPARARTNPMDKTVAIVAFLFIVHLSFESKKEKNTLT